jgi:hypothetical protein
VGNTSLSKFKNVSYQKKEFSDVTNDRVTYDALIITKDAFSEADKEKYIQLYNSIKYPVFFFGTENVKDFAFLSENTSIDMAKIRDSGYVQGFINMEGTRTKWDLHLPNNPSDLDKNKKMLIRMFKIIELYKNKK